MQAILTALKARTPQWVKSHAKIVSGLAAGLVIGGAGSVAVLAAVPDAGGVIHGCYRSGGTLANGTLRVIDTEAGGTCNNNETAISWNQTGPQGPQGPQGPVGPQGPAGPAGDGALAYGRVITWNGDLPPELDTQRSQGVVSVITAPTAGSSYYCIDLEPGIVPTNVVFTKISGGDTEVVLEGALLGLDWPAEACPSGYDIFVRAASNFYFRAY